MTKAIVRSQVSDRSSARHPKSVVEARATVSHGRILVVDDDRHVREALGRTAEYAGLSCNAVGSATQAIEIAGQTEFDLWLIDWRLPEPAIRGTDLVRLLRSAGHLTPFILFSGFLNTSVVVEAMRLGARDVLEKPVDDERLIQSIALAIGSENPELHITLGPRTGHLHPLAKRVALLILQTLHSPHEVSTITEWAPYSRFSDRWLRDVCTMFGVPAKDVRDFMRALCAVVWSAREQCDAALLLDIDDARTFQEFCKRAGFVGQGAKLDLVGYLRDQTFLPPANPILLAIRRLLKTPA